MHFVSCSCFSSCQRFKSAPFSSRLIPIGGRIFSCLSAFTRPFIVTLWRFEQMYVHFYFANIHFFLCILIPFIWFGIVSLESEHSLLMHVRHALSSISRPIVWMLCMWSKYHVFASKLKLSRISPLLCAKIIFQHIGNILVLFYFNLLQLWKRPWQSLYSVLFKCSEKNLLLSIVCNSEHMLVLLPAWWLFH